MYDLKRIPLVCVHLETLKLILEKTEWKYYFMYTKIYTGISLIFPRTYRVQEPKNNTWITRYNVVCAYADIQFSPRTLLTIGVKCRIYR